MLDKISTKMYYYIVTKRKAIKMIDYQDYDFIQEYADKRLDFSCYDENVRRLVISCWNTLRRINCQDEVVFETVMNGMCNAWEAGANYEYLETKRQQ